ncbi:MAG: glycosyltransferase family 4 protein, partial [Actinobacteria bacterium]|nr:glycosyltransferase family 4 protein [Actinomycetota bacterium]
YPVTPGIVPLLERERPDVVVASGWSTFASQAAIAWCRVRRVPYVLVVESHDRDPRPGWRRAVKQAVVPRVVGGAASILVTGSLARESMLARGARPDRVYLFANTVDVELFAARHRELEHERPRLREALGLDPDDVVVLSVARLVPEKGLDTLIRAAAAAGSPIALLLAGAGPERERLVALAGSLRVQLVLAGDVDWRRIHELYAAADVFALLSRHEPWGVVVNEAAAAGLPLVLSENVGAAADLLRHGENGFLVAADDSAAAARALAMLAADPARRATAGSASTRIAASWGYQPSVDAFVAAVQTAASSVRCSD